MIVVYHNLCGRYEKMHLNLMYIMSLSKMQGTLRIRQYENILVNCSSYGFNLLIKILMQSSVAFNLWTCSFEKLYIKMCHDLNRIRIYCNRQNDFLL